MANAEVGEAVHGENLTVRALEEATASVVGTELVVCRGDSAVFSCATDNQGAGNRRFRLRVT